MHPTLEKNKNYIILGAFAVGILFIFEVLPEELVGLAKGTSNLIYAGVIALGAVLFFKGYMKRIEKKKPMPMPMRMPPQQYTRPPYTPPQPNYNPQQTYVPPTQYNEETEYS